MTSLSRRDALSGTAAAVVAMPAARGPWFQPQRRPQLRVLGTHVTLQEQIRVRAERDLDIELVFAPGGSAAVLQKVSAGSFRRGGSHVDRFSRVAVWNTVMETYEYSMLKWYEFLTA